MKQVIIIRKDLKMSCGKMIAQACHASLRAVDMTNYGVYKTWVEDFIEMKVVLKVYSEEELNGIAQKCRENDLVVAGVQDAGRTQIPEGSFTALAIGPDEDEKIDKIVGGLKLL